MACKIKTAIYIRVSTEEQAAEGQSIAAQEEILTQYCRLYNIEIHDIYKDLGISGKDTKNRPGLVRMLQEAKNHSFNMVLVWKISRLSRSLKDLLLILEELEREGIVFSSHSEKFDTSTSVGKMTLQLLGSIAEFERNTIVDNVRLGLGEFARKGGKASTVLGYDNINKKLAINPEEAEIVKTIYSLYTQEHLSTTEIAEFLQTMNYKTKRSKAFSKDSVAVILSNPVYIGVNRHKIGQEDEFMISSCHAPIVDEAVWKQAQELIKKNHKKRSPRNGASSFLLSGKIKCPYCNNPMNGFTSGAADKRYRYYKCKRCGVLCNADSLEDIVLQQLKEKLLQHDFSCFSNSLIPAEKQPKTKDKDLRQLLSQQKLLDGLLDRYVLLIHDHDLSCSEILLSKIKELERQLADLNMLIKGHRISSSIPLKSTGFDEEMLDALEKMDKKAIKQCIESRVDCIILNTDKTFKDILLLPD